MLSQRLVKFIQALPLLRATDGRYGTSTGALFLSTPLLAESDASRHQNRTAFSVFLSTLSLRESDFSLLACRPGHRISIHALLAESDKYLTGGQNPAPRFLSTLSLRRATDKDQVVKCLAHDFIHALPAESDYIMTIIICTAWRFLSTLSLRRATPFRPSNNIFRYIFYPRSPCGEATLLYHFCPVGDKHFLSTLSLRRATLLFTTRHPAVRVFLSTLSLRRATLTDCTKFYPIGISIHALLAESDLYSSSSSTPAVHFLSTLSLRRATNAETPMYTAPSPFLSTLSLRRATGVPCMIASNIFFISIHALLCGERRQSVRHSIMESNNFYPRSPCGERRYTARHPSLSGTISIHALLAESDVLKS